MLLRHVYSLNVKPVKPYSFDLTASCYAISWEYDGHNAYITLDYDKHVSLVKVSPREDELLFEVYADTSSSDIIDSAIRDARFILGVDEDLTNFYGLCKNDPLLGILAERFIGMRIRAVQNLWQGILISICQQNASFKQGWKMLLNIRRKLGKPLQIPNNPRIMFTYPSPRQVIEKFDFLKDCRVGYRDKVILNAARFFLENESEELEKIKGIGQYSARLARILGLRKYDKFPVDRWFSVLIPKVYANEDKWTIRRVEEFAAKKWDKWAGLAAVMITVITGAKTLTKLLEDIQQGKLSPLPDEPAPLTLWRYET